MLVSGKEIFQDAKLRKYAVGAFNINNMEILQAIVEAAEELNSPVFIQASQGGIRYAGLEYIAGMGKIAAAKAKVPVALNIDHGTDFNQVVRCIRHGFSAVMIDGSKLPFEENIAITRKIVEVAHPNDVSVEAELGKISGVEDDVAVAEHEALFTDPDEAYEFAERTNCDALAVAVGTAHGVYRGEPKIDFERLQAISSKVNTPLVLHGASGLADDVIQKAIGYGIVKINIDTDLRIAFSEAVRKVVKEHPDEIDPRNIMGPAKEAVKKVVKAKMHLFGSVGKA
ncbi:MAG: class II fructose-1,6-bisphosphate aldolase [Firmicutes bacterium]|nr:class II fructose-1,6-bisphosphate aldolase [Bacillota bacterium]NLL89077.1 class II fructose-1,6-bisphosphate aldolase [Bacillota bacterium]HKM17550.1 class II fructose-1,6-bisphosphate aldolase [Limnochordia bacterium]